MKACLAILLQDKLTNLETLYLYVCRLTNQGWIDLLNMCGTNLKFLNLGGNKDLTGEGLSILKEKLINLETLLLDRCPKLTNQGLTEVLQICGSKLKVLKITDNKDLTGEGLSFLQDKLINLETVYLYRCSHLLCKALSEL